MIKWSECYEGGVVFEVFLPEHETEQQAWLLRASRVGHIIEERRVRLTWPPRFGSDIGDVAAIEAELDSVVSRIVALSEQQTSGSYVPKPCEIPESNPYVHAILHALVEQYAEAESYLRLLPAQSAVYLDLAEGLSAKGLYPMAVTRRRDARMHRMIALANVLQRNQRLQPRSPELLAAVLRDEPLAIRAILVAEGVDIGEPAP